MGRGPHVGEAKQARGCIRVDGCCGEFIEPHGDKAREPSGFAELECLATGHTRGAARAEQTARMRGEIRWRLVLTRHAGGAIGQVPNVREQLEHERGNDEVEMRRVERGELRENRARDREHKWVLGVLVGAMAGHLGHRARGHE